MALPTVATVEAAVTGLFDALKDAKFREPNALARLLTLWEVIPTIRKIYTPALSVTVNDSTDASVAAAIAATGELGIAWAAANTGETTFRVGQVFTVTGAGDFTDNALGTAKGGVVAAGDIYQIDSATTVLFLGTAQPDFTADEVADF